MKKRKTVKKRYVIALVIVIAGLITLWRILNAPVPTYQTLIVRPGDLQQSVLATGKLDALRKVDVGAQVSGQLKTLSVAIGDKVKKDQLLGVMPVSCLTDWHYSRSGWHFAFRMYTMRQKSYATAASTSTGTITLA
ncbi:macrolide efflux protein MacA [Shigella boydii 5216-82]|nr:macrolide efflux protein MacA [Shigella boydii 5216-82]